METLEHEIYNDPAIDGELISENDPFYGDANERDRGTILRWIVGVSFMVFGVIAFGSDTRIGVLGYKITIVAITSLLLFSPPSYPYLVGLLIPIWYYLRPPGAGGEGYYSVQFASLMVILMSIGRCIWSYSGENRRNPHQYFDLGSFCLLGIIGIAIVGVVMTQNPYHYFRRIVEIMGFGSAFYLGKTCLSIRKTLRLLLMGLIFGMLTFDICPSFGYIAREGVGNVFGGTYVSRSLAGERGAAASGGLILVFALAYSLSSNVVISRTTRRIALWLVAIPAAIAIMIYSGRVAILLLPVVIVLNLVFSGRRRTAIFVALISMIVAAVAYTQIAAVQSLFAGFISRMTQFGGGLSTRQSIWLTAIGFGKSHLLFGIGAGQFQAHSRFYINAHNEILNIFAEHGIFAVVLYVLFWFYLGTMAIKLRMSRDLFLRSMAGVYMVLLPVYLVFTIRGPLYFDRSGILLAFSAGILATLYSRSKEIQNV